MSERSPAVLIEDMREAAAKLPEAFIHNHPEIAWRKLVGMRNRLIHGYFGVSLKLVWQAIRNDMPDLQDKLARMSPLPTHCADNSPQP